MSIHSQNIQPRRQAALLVLIGGMAVLSLAQPAPDNPPPPAAAVVQTTLSNSPQDTQQPELAPGAQGEDQLSRKQRKGILKANFEKMKRDADELATLAKDLQTDLDKSSENVLSLQIIEKAEKIEKLAKKIKSAARGF